MGHSTHFNVTTTAMAPRQLLSQPHCRDGPGARSWAEYGAAAHARCVAPTLDHFGANSGQKRPGIRPAWLGHGAPRERQRHRSVRRTKTAYFSHCASGEVGDRAGCGARGFRTSKTHRPSLQSRRFHDPYHPLLLLGPCHADAVLWTLPSRSPAISLCVSRSRSTPTRCIVLRRVRMRIA